LLRPLGDQLRRLDEQRKLGIRLDQPVDGQRHGPYRDPARPGECEGPLGGLPEIPVERLLGQRNAPLGAGVIGVLHLNAQSLRR